MDVAEPSPRRLGPRWIGGLGLVALLALAACGLVDDAKDEAIEQLAIGTWVCAPAADGASESPFTLTIDDGTFSAEMDSEGGTTKPLTGTWDVDDGDLTVTFDLRGADGTQMLIERFDELTPDSTGFTMAKPGLYEATQNSEDMTPEELEAAAGPTPLDVEVTTDGTDSITLDTDDGDPWTCDRQ